MLSPWLYHGVSGVDLFFVISGFIMVYISRQNFGNIAHIPLFLYHRVVRIYPPAILFTALALLAIIINGTTQKWLPGNNLLFSFLLLPQKADPLLGVSWTLIHELYFYLVFAVLLLGRYRHLWLGLMLWALVIVWAHYKGFWGLNAWSLVAFHPLTFEFILGALMAMLLIRFKPRFGALAVLFGAALMVAGAAHIGFPIAYEFPTGWGRVIAFAPGAALMVYGMVALEIRSVWQAPRILVLLGNWSYSLYLSHMLVISTIAHLFAPYSKPTLMSHLMYILLSLSASFVVAAMAYYGFERPLLRLSKNALQRHLVK